MWFSNARSFDAIPQQNFLSKIPDSLGYHERKKTTEKRRGRTTSSTAPKRARAPPTTTHELGRVVPPNANRDPVLLNHVVLDHRRVRFRGKKFFFFIQHLSSSKIQSLCKPEQEKERD